MPESLSNLNPMFIKEGGPGLTQTELWQGAVQIELADNNLSELPLSPNWLKLTVLVLRGTADLTKIPSLVFINMPLLQFLDLSYTSVRELPSSFFNLEQLRQLYLKGCECFMKLPPDIGKLRKLEELDLEETQIIHLPKEFQELTNMQSLTLCFYEHRGKKSKPYSCPTIIPSGVISKLKGLKHLRIDVNPDDKRWPYNVRVILPEIMGLKCLQTLSLYVPQLELLKIIPTRILDVDFRFIVGCHMQRIISSISPAVDVKFKQSDRSLKFVKGVDVPYEIKILLGHSNAFFLDRHRTLKDLSEFGMTNLEELRVCILAECKEMQTIVDGRKSRGNSNANDNYDVLSRLLFLSVSHMKNLRSIWEGPTPPHSIFGMLKSLSLQNCPKLLTLFSLDFLHNFSLLKVLIVKDCAKISSLISHGSTEPKVGIFLPKLSKLSLVHLPELVSISNGLHIGTNLKEIGIYDCPKLRSLSIQEFSSQKLTIIKGETNWWKALKWSQLEWGISAWPPPRFHSIFSAINKDTDVMTQLGTYMDDDGHDDDDIVDDTGMYKDEDFVDDTGPLFSLAIPKVMDASWVEGKRTLKYEDEDQGFGEDGRKTGVMKDLYCYSVKRGPKAGASSMPPCCQVDNCNVDLSIAKQYHRRQKVCEYHTKAHCVLLAGQHQRFCQQCGRFHKLSEFDDSRRSCRRRLAGHNERRRKIASDYHRE